VWDNEKQHRGIYIGEVPHRPNRVQQNGALDDDFSEICRVGGLLAQDLLSPLGCLPCVTARDPYRSLGQQPPPGQTLRAATGRRMYYEITEPERLSATASTPGGYFPRHGGESGRAQSRPHGLSLASGRLFQNRKPARQGRGDPAGDAGSDRQRVSAYERPSARGNLYPLMNASRSALMVSAFVVGIPCGKPL
jgi:hypothetical protein